MLTILSSFLAHSNLYLVRLIW